MFFPVKDKGTLKQNDHSDLFKVNNEIAGKGRAKKDVDYYKRDSGRDH